MTLCSTGNLSSWREKAYDYVMTPKSKKTGPLKLKDPKSKSDKRRPGNPKQRASRPRPTEWIELRASVEDDVLSAAEEETRAESRWHRPRKERVSLRVDTEVVDWFKSKGPGYQTRMNRVLRTVMMEGKKRAGQG